MTEEGMTVGGITHGDNHINGTNGSSLNLCNTCTPQTLLGGKSNTSTFLKNKFNLVSKAIM